MTDEVRHFFAMPPEDEREAWREWLRRHSVDPGLVVIPGWIERRPGAYQLAYRSWELREDGGPRYDEECRDFLWMTRVAQLEGPPLPFPFPAVQGHWDR